MDANKQKTERDQESVEALEAARAEYQALLKNNKQKKDTNVVQKAKCIFQHVENVAHIRLCHEELLEAEIMLIEAASDAEGLRARNAAVAQQLDDERQRKIDADRDAALAKAEATEAKKVCLDITARSDDEAKEFFGNLANGDKPIALLEAEIETEEAALGFIHVNDHGAIRKYKEREVEIEKLKNKIDEANEKLEALGTDILETREKWEPELDKLIAKISDAFSYNFETIGCAGEVGVHKDEEFADWSIEIKVKFRQVLSAVISNPR